MNLDHVAVLADDIEPIAEAWKLPDAQEIEAFPGEGTRELYCGAERRSGRVLLMQPIGPGPYARAMTKRGPGLHHVALRVDDVRGFVTSMAGNGWLLHPKSLETFESHRQAWLCRPGFPCLIELSEGPVSYEGAYAREVSLSVPDSLAPLIDRLGRDDLVRAPGIRHSSVVDGRRIWIERWGDRRAAVGRTHGSLLRPGYGIGDTWNMPTRASRTLNPKRS